MFKCPGERREILAGAGNNRERESEEGLELRTGQRFYNKINTVYSHYTDCLLLLLTLDFN